MYTLHLIVTDIKAIDFRSLYDIHAKVARGFRIAPGYPIMFGNAATWLIGRSMNGIADVFTDVDDRYQLLYFSRREPLTVDAIERIRIEIPSLRSHITN